MPRASGLSKAPVNTDDLEISVWGSFLTLWWQYCPNYCEFLATVPKANSLAKPRDYKQAREEGHGQAVVQRSCRSRRHDENGCAIWNGPVCLGDMHLCTTGRKLPGIIMIISPYDLRKVITLNLFISPSITWRGWAGWEQEAGLLCDHVLMEIPTSQELRRELCHPTNNNTPPLMLYWNPGVHRKKHLIQMTILSPQTMQPVISRTYFAVIEQGSSRKKLYKISLNGHSFETRASQG